MKYMIYMTFMVTLMSCSSLVDLEKREELSGIERVEIGQKSYIKPQFYVEDYKFGRGRSIASVDEESIPQELILGRKISNRELYFLTYYKQYITLGNLLEDKEIAQSCPSFHGAILDHKEFLTEKSGGHSTKINLEHLKDKLSMVTKYPLMAIPFSNQTDLFSVLIQNGFNNPETYVHTALENYYQKQKKEISVLCDEGVSSGYFIYENLVSYFKQTNSFHKTKAGLRALLKVPVMGNMLILDNLEQEQALSFRTSLSRFENILLERSRVSWFTEYRKSLKRARQKEIGLREISGSKI